VIGTDFGREDQYDDQSTIPLSDKHEVIVVAVMLQPLALPCDSYGQIKSNYQEKSTNVFVLVPHILNRLKTNIWPVKNCMKYMPLPCPN
jgi:hypothetical protein